MNCRPQQFSQACCATQAPHFALPVCSPPPLFFATDGARGVLLAFRCPEEQVRAGGSLVGMHTEPIKCLHAGLHWCYIGTQAERSACSCWCLCAGNRWLCWPAHCAPPLSSTPHPPVLQPSYGSVSTFLRHAKLSYWLQGVRVRVLPICIACRTHCLRGGSGHAKSAVLSGMPWCAVRCRPLNPPSSLVACAAPTALLHCPIRNR